MARAQERTTTYPVQTANTFFLTLPCRPNGLCTNREGTQCAVGGRNLLKVFSIEEKRFVEKVNLVAGPKKLNYSITDVQWHPTEENIIASSAGNGVVILWDLNKVNESKQDHLFQQHYRFVNKLCFHPTDPALLMSCSQDGNMHCFDIRQKKLSETFCGKTDGIRDIQFHPTDKNIFCSACEGGNVQLWDIRKPDHHYNQFQAHSGPVFTLNWHPDDRFWLSTGGRDKTIKIWDTQLKTHPTHVIQTIAPVACIKWRPGYKFHIASCALVLDNNVTIWDIRRPFVPFAAFEEHTDVATGIIWQKDPDVILSCSKDMFLYNHAVADAERPAEHAPPVALSFASNGHLAHGLPDTMLRYVQMKSTGYPSQPKSSQTVNEPTDFRVEKSTLNVHSINNEKEVDTSIMEEALIGVLAKEYKFYGKPFAALCEYNSNVANNYGLSEKAFTWSLLKQLYIDEIVEDNSIRSVSEQQPSPTSINSNVSFGSESKVNTRKMDTPETFYNNGNLGFVNSNNNGSSSSDDEMGIHTPSSLLQNAKVHDEITMIGPELDAVFGDDEYSRQLFSTELETEENELDCVPDEAIQLRQSFGEKAIQNHHSHIEEEEEERGNYSGMRQTSLFALDVADWEFKPIVKDMLYFYAERGDIQMCVTVMLVLNSRVKGMIDREEQEEWYNGYLDILFKLHLFNVATEVINCAPESVSHLNQNSTTVHMQCESCSKVILCAKPGWFCDHCKKITQNCAICHIPVKGLFVWCQGCGHGGHLIHLKEWFKKSTYCPTGCGHKCEYS